MTKHQQIAAALLRRLGTDGPLIGDLLEEYEDRRSRIWLWTQVAVAAAVSLSGRARHARPHRAAKINLAATPRGSAVGGLGLLALVVLITVVAPRLWWVLGIALAGGLFLGAIMIAVARQRLARSNGGRRNVLLPVLLFMTLAVSIAPSPGQQRPHAVRQDPIEGIVEAFKSHHVVMLPGGHGSKPFHDLLLAIARDSG